MASKFGQADHPPPDGRVRQSQALTNYASGAMVDLLHDAVLVGGLDFWGSQSFSKRFDEPRLRARLQRRFPHLRDEKPFVMPPEGDEHEPNRRCGIQVLEFPIWFVCQKPSCRRLVRVGPGCEMKADRYVHAECKDYLVPVRFVMACIDGHIQDFPWARFVHDTEEKRARCQSRDLKLLEGATGDFSELAVLCLGCNQSMPLLAATGDGAGRFKCEGHQPWMNGKVPCDQTLRLLVRTASNSYFAEVVSSLDIPEPPSPAAIVHEHWSILGSATETSLPHLRAIPHVGAALRAFNDAQVLEAVRNKVEKRTPPTEEPRTAEFQRFIMAEPDRAGDYPPDRATFFVRRHVPERPLPAGIARVVLAHRLREVRVQTGFTRFEARTPDLQGEYPEESLGVKVAPLAADPRWLPGIEIFGEGFFVQLDEHAVRAWEDRPEVRRRIDTLLAGHDAKAKALAHQGRQAPPFHGARLYLLHSLSHLLVQAVSLECGYSASSIRERIYCADRKAPTPMAAILFSTGTPGAEGTLGGLLEEGRALSSHLARAFDQGVLCSNDPVCAAHDPGRDPTERYLQGAACHGCLFIAEPSCEHQNRFLDRALVVPTIGHEGAAFFRERP
jgi:hypothetical protein